MLWGIDIRIMFEVRVLSHCKTQKVETKLLILYSNTESASLTTIYIFACL